MSRLSLADLNVTFALLTPCRRALVSSTIPSMVLDGERYAFLVEWRDAHGDAPWQYQLLYYSETKQVEMHDMKSRRIFLKRSTFEHVLPEMLCVGSTVNILSRQLHVVDYGDQATRDALKAVHEKAWVFLRATDIQSLGQCIQHIAAKDVRLNGLKLTRLLDKEVRQVVAADPTLPLNSWMLKETVLVMEVIGLEAAAKMVAFRESLPFEKDPGNDTKFSAASVYTASWARELFPCLIPADVNWTEGSTLAIIKPHALLDGSEGLILEDISQRFWIHNILTTDMTPAEATTFFEVYAEAWTPGEFAEQVNQMTSGKCIAVHCSSKDLEVESSVEALRGVCGPMDPELARHVRPESLRARFGIDTARNAVHCTDLEEDARLEVDRLFHS